MTEPLAFNEQELFEELVTQGIAEAVVSEEAWSQLIENVLDEHAMWGELHDDQNLEGIEANMRARFSEYRARLDEKEA